VTFDASGNDPFFQGDAEMARRVREFDWASTPVGAMADWPQSLKTIVRVMLDSRYAMWLGWGAHFTFFYNDAYGAMSLGPKHPWALGRPAREVWAEIWPDIGPRAESVMQTGRATWDEGLRLFLERRGFPEETYHSFSYSPVPDDRGNVGGLLCVVNEDTERTLGERRLRTLQELAAHTTRASRSVEQACETAARTCATNPYDLPFLLLYLLDEKGKAILAGTAGLAPGGPASPIMVDVDAHEGGWPLGEVARTGEAMEIDNLGATFGSLHIGPWPESPERALVLPMRGTGPARITGFVVAGLSSRLAFSGAYRAFLVLLAGQVTAAVAAAGAYQEERRRAVALEELDRAKTAFFSNVSHEFRTPLTLMLGPLEDALRAPTLTIRERESIEVAHRNSLRLLRLVNTLLDFSRIEAGRVEVVYEPVDIARYTSELASVFRSATERAGLSLDVSCEPTTAQVFVDREMWEKVVLNLLSNAFKFTLRGGITVSLRERAEAVELVVGDTGVGIPAGDLTRVFERFHRVRGVEGRTHEGTGIGLALVAELVKLHGGRVSVESEPGRGSAFTVTIPTGSAHLPAERIGAKRQLASTALGAMPYVEEALRWLSDRPEQRPLEVPEPLTAISTTGGRVLLADDNADMRDYVARLLRPYWDVEAVADGMEALEAIRARRPDLVLSDVMMPRLDGLGLLREIRSEPTLRTLPVILLSARAGEESRIEGLDLGADDYLIKPFSARELIARVSAHLAMARMRAEAAAELERAAATLQKEEARYRALVEATSAIVWCADASGSVTDTSQGEAITGQTREQYLGNGWIEAIHPEDRERTLAIWANALRDNTPAAGEHRLKLPDGTYRWMSVTAVPIRGSSGEVEEWVGTVTDIDARKRAERQREELLGTAERARSEAESANQAKDAFLAVLSHELRSPMNAMLGWLRILKSAETRDPAIVTRAIDTLERNIHIQAQVINDLLDVSRIMSGKLELEHVHVDLAAVVASCVESLRPLAEGKQVGLHLLIKAAQLEVVGDSARLQQVVSNLLGNAIKFTDTGGRITVTVERREESACMIVEDTGQGIAPEFLPHLFERFRQADSAASRRHGGLGLGLAIVKNLVALHGGEIRAESDGVGRGARFSVMLPVAEGRYRLAFPTPTPSMASEPLPLDVLVVEDDADSREALEWALRETGARVRSAESVQQALAAHAARPPDVVISDVGMPGEDGYVLIRAIREREEGRSHRTLAIAMTGFAGREDREMALRAGFDEHVAKPAELEQLLDRVRMLERSRRRAASAQATD